MCAHREAGDQAAFDERMRVVAHDVAVLAGAGFGFIRVDDEIVRAFLHFLRHERPFHAGREARAAAATQAGFLHLVHDGIDAALEDLLGAIPAAARHRAFEANVLEAVEIGEDAVFVGEHQVAAPGGFWV